METAPEGMTREQKREFYISRRVFERLVRRAMGDISLQEFSNSLTPEEYRELTFFNRTVPDFYSEHHGKWEKTMRGPMETGEGFIDIKDLKKGTVYRIASRNLALGVWDGKNGFIGIRSKFGGRYLDTELEWTTSRHYGTARAKEALGAISETIPLETSGSFCGKCGRPVNFDIERPEAHRWQHIEDGSDMCPKVLAQIHENKELRAELEKFEKEHAVGWP